MSSNLIDPTMGHRRQALGGGRSDTQSRLAMESQLMGDFVSTQARIVSLFVNPSLSACPNTEIDAFFASTMAVEASEECSMGVKSISALVVNFSK